MFSNGENRNLNLFGILHIKAEFLALGKTLNIFIDYLMF